MGSERAATPEVSTPHLVTWPVYPPVPAGGSGRRASTEREGRLRPPPALERGVRESWPKPCPPWPPCWRERLLLAEVHLQFLPVGEGCPDWSKLDAIKKEGKKDKIVILGTSKDFTAFLFVTVIPSPLHMCCVWTMDVLFEGKRLPGKGSSRFN